MSGKPANPWWGAPKNFDERKYERKVSWLELFYDLVYVAAISQLTHNIAEHPTLHNIWFAFLIFSLIFWSWVNGSQYYDLHGQDSIRTRLFTFLQMLGVAAAAVAITDTFHGHHQALAIALSVIQIIITYLWWSVGLYDPSHKMFNIFYTVNYLIAFAFLILSIFTSFYIATILWIIVLVLNLTPPLTGYRTIVRETRKRGQEFTASATIVERFGLFTIIVLAESILGTVSGIAEVKDKGPGAWIAFILGILISFLLWCLYFDMTSEQETKKGYGFMQWLIFLHFPLLAAMGVVGASIKLALADIDTGMQPSVQWMFCGSVSVILFMIIAISRIMKEEEEDRAYIKPVARLLGVFGILMLTLPLFCSRMSSVFFLAVIALMLFIPVFAGIRSWVRYKFLR